MRKGIYQIIDELKEKPTLTLSEINNICNEFNTDRRCIDVFGAIIQYTSLTGNVTDLTDFEFPNTKETWIEIASALATQYYLCQPMEYSIEDISRNLEIPVEDIISFLKQRNYIIYKNGIWRATVLGIEKGYTDNTNEGLILTEKCEEKIRKAFSYEFSPEEQKRIDAICAEAERTMKPFSCGKAE